MGLEGPIDEYVSKATGGERLKARWKKRDSCDRRLSSSTINVFDRFFRAETLENRHGQDCSGIHAGHGLFRSRKLVSPPRRFPSRVINEIDVSAQTSRPAAS